MIARCGDWVMVTLGAKFPWVDARGFVNGTYYFRGTKNLHIDVFRCSNHFFISSFFFSSLLELTSDCETHHLFTFTFFVGFPANFIVSEFFFYI